MVKNSIGTEFRFQRPVGGRRPVGPRSDGRASGTAAGATPLDAEGSHCRVNPAWSILSGLFFRVYSAADDSRDCRSREAALPFNPKRRIAAAPDPDALEDLAARVRYGGNPEHKRNPGDFGLTPPARPRADKSKCDWAGIVEQAVALHLLRQGIRRGLISPDYSSCDFPGLIFSIVSRPRSLVPPQSLPIRLNRPTRWAKFPLVHCSFLMTGYHPVLYDNRQT